MAISESLRQAFLQARYFVQTPAGELMLAIGRRHPATVRLLRANQADGMAIVTAWNPQGRPAPEADNLRAQAALQQQAGRLGLLLLHGYNLAGNADEANEPTVVILGATRDQGNCLAHQFDQLAWVYVSDTGTPELIWTDAQQHTDT